MTEEHNRKLCEAEKGKIVSDTTKAKMSTTHYTIYQRVFIKQAILNWLELREQNLKKLVYASDDETKLKYLAQIDFIETARINIKAIMDKSETIK